jgi:hypothetical protein
MKRLVVALLVSVDYVYNPTGPEYDKTFWDNLKDVGKQKSHEGILDMTLDDYTDFWMEANDLHYPKDSKEYQKLRASIIPTYQDKIKSSAGDNYSAIIDNFHGVVPVEFAGVVNLLNTPYKPNPLYASKYTTFTDDSHIKHMSSLKEDNKTADDLQDAVDNYFIAHQNLQTQQDYSKTKNLVLFVPHSQGNIYTNWLYKYLTATDGTGERFPATQIAIYGVASPASKNVGDWIAKDVLDTPTIRAQWGEINSYITSGCDMVIQFAKTMGDVLPVNLELPFHLFSALGHNFIDVYLSDPISKKQIVKMVTLEAMELVKTMNASTRLRHFGIAMYTYMQPYSYFMANPSIRQNQDDDLLCDGRNGTFSCVGSVLSFPSLNTDYSLGRTSLYFPQSDFGGNQYTYLRPRGIAGDGFGYDSTTQIILPEKVHVIKHAISCGGYGNCADYSPAEGLDANSFFTGYAWGYDGFDYSAMYNNFSPYFESGVPAYEALFIALKFNLPYLNLDERNH